MATRATPPADAAAAPSAALSTAQADGAVDAAMSAPPAAAQLVPQVALDASAYEPTTAISAYANAAAVAASTAVLTTAPALAQLPAVATRRTGAAPTTPTPAAASLSARNKLRHSSKFGTVNYSIDEMRRLNDKVRTVMPIASEDWLHVAYQFNYMRPESIPYREVESLKRKFKKMYCSRSTVGGKLPDYVQDAKELRKQINQRSERAQIQLEQLHSDSQSEIDAHDAGQTQGDEPAAAGVDETADSSGAVDSSSLAANTAPGTITADAESTGMDAGNDDTRDIAARLRVMEEEYHRSMASKRGSSSDGLITSSPSTGVAAAMFGDPSAFASLSGADSTTGIINLLKHSIERKRRTIEEQMLSESERVRKERKKRKMEQVLYNIHREQTGATAAATESIANGPPASPGSAIGSAFPAAPLAPTLPGLAPFPLTQDASSSLGLMEIVLQYMITQQQETARRIHQEEERRRIEEEARERRRRAKEAQRRKDKHEMMLVMAALLQESFPEELRTYLDPATLHREENTSAQDVGNGKDRPPPTTGSLDNATMDVVEEHTLL